MNKLKGYSLTVFFKSGTFHLPDWRNVTPGSSSGWAVPLPLQADRSTQGTCKWNGPPQDTGGSFRPLVLQVGRSTSSWGGTIHQAGRPTSRYRWIVPPTGPASGPIHFFMGWIVPPVGLTSGPFHHLEEVDRSTRRDGPALYQVDRSAHWSCKWVDPPLEQVGRPA